MQTFKVLSQSIRGQIASLSVNAKLFMGTLLIIMVMAASLATLYMGSSSTETLPISLTPESRQRAIQFLATTGLDWHEEQGVIHVPLGQRDHVISRLSEEGVISPDQINFDSMVRDENLFLTKGQYQTRTRVATQNVLAGMIARMRNIQSATVVISGGDDSVGIGRAFIERSASVTVLSKENEIDQVLVDAIARMVAGATHGLKSESVAVIDARTGRSFYARSHETTSVNPDLKHATEVDARAVLVDLLGYIPGVRINVHAIRVSRVSNPVASAAVPLAESMSGPAPGPFSAKANLLEELGIRANMGMHLSSIVEDQVLPVAEDVEGAGDDDVSSFIVNVSIAVPRTYMMDVHSAKYGTAQVDNIVFDDLVHSTLADVRSQVEALLSGSSNSGESAGEISVTMFTEAGPPVDTAGQQPSSWVTMLADSHALRTIGLGTLAFLTAAMMFVILRRAGGHAVNTRYESMGTAGSRSLSLVPGGGDGEGAVHLPAAAIEHAGGVAIDSGMPEGCTLTAETVVGTCSEEDPVLIEQDPTSITRFEDLLGFDDDELGMLCRRISQSDLALSLKTASNELKARFFSNLHRSITDSLLDEMEAIGPVHLCDIESAQERILDTARDFHSPAGHAD